MGTRFVCRAGRWECIGPSALKAAPQDDNDFNGYLVGGFSGRIFWKEILEE